MIYYDILLLLLFFFFGIHKQLELAWFPKRKMFDHLKLYFSCQRGVKMRNVQIKKYENVNVGNSTREIRHRSNLVGNDYVYIQK